MGDAVDAAIVGVSNALDSIASQYAKDQCIDTAWEGFLSALDCQQLLKWHQKIHANHIGIRKDNRGGAGMILANAIKNGANSIASGYSYKKACSGAFAISTAGSPIDAEEMAFNKNNAEMQGLPFFEGILGLPLGATHCNSFLRAILAKSPCNIDAIAPQGYLDATYLCHKSPQLKQALDDGLLWTLFHPKVFEKYPVFKTIAMDALNNKVDSPLGELEGINIIKASLPYGEKEAVEVATKTHPAYTSWACKLLAFAKAVTSDQLQDPLVCLYCCVL